MPPPPATIPAHPPPSESATNTSPEQQKQQPQSPPPPPPPSSGVESEAPPKRRRLEEVGFQRSPYYTIRETVANLRGRFLQVCQGTDSQKNAASVEILKEMKSVMELSKKTRLGLSAAAEPVEPFDKPAARAPEDKPAGKVASAEQNQVPLTSLAGDSMQNTGGDVPLKPDDSDAAAHSLLVESKRRSRSSKATGVTHTNQHGLPQGSYVIGGSPIDWNFLMWPGSKAVYYGLTKAEWLARRSAK